MEIETADNETVKAAQMIAKRVEHWEALQNTIEETKRTLNSLECRLMNDTQALGKFLAAKDAKEGEKFVIPVGDGWLQVTRENQHDYTVVWRNKPTRR